MSTSAKESTRSGWLMPLAAALAAVAVVVAVSAGVFGLRAGGGSAAPPVLHLASVSGGPPGLPTVSGAAASEEGGGVVASLKGSGWRLQGTLPQGPTSGPVHLLGAGPVARAFVVGLASSLGMRGDPQHLRAGWYLRSGATELSVSELAGRHWVYSNHGCIAGPALDPQVGTVCDVASSAPPIPPAAGARSASGGAGIQVPPSSSPVPLPRPAPVPANIVASLARPVLVAVGVNPSAAQVQTAGGQASVVVNPVVADLAVQGLETRVAIDEHGRIVDASGWLATSSTGPRYPLISARKAYDQLLAQPQPMMVMALPCRIVAGIPGCAPVPARVVTGATLGLTQAYSNHDILLVPAWLFHLRGEPTPMAVVAIDQAYLGEPSTGTAAGTTGGASGSNPQAKTGSPGQVEPYNPIGQPATKPPR